MYYYYQPYYHQSPYNQTNSQPIVRASFVSHNPMHQGAQHSTQMHPNYLRYITQNNGVPEQRNENQLPQNGSPSPFPPVDPELLYQSANQSNKLMKEASMVLDRLASSKEFGARLMDLAQHSNNQEVERLIHSVGITSEVEINYNPDGLELEFKSKVKNLDCCKLSISLRWR